MELLLIVCAVAAFYAYRRWRLGRGASSGSAFLQGPGTFRFEIVGESHYQDVLCELAGGRTPGGAKQYCDAVIVLDDDHPHDSKAVRVDISGKTVGYLSRDDARNYREQLRRAGHPRLVATCRAVIVGGWARGTNSQGFFGVKLDLPIRQT